MGDRRSDKMGIDDVKGDIADKVKVGLAPPEKLSMTTHCICCAQSFFLDYPACCGINVSQKCCCMSKEAGVLCLQFKDEHKVIGKGRSESRCIDCTQDDCLCMEAAEENIACWGLCVGAQKAWCGHQKEKFDPCFIQGNQLCCDSRIACPPAPETVPKGMACCGKHFWGEPMPSNKEGAGDAAAGADKSAE